MVLGYFTEHTFIRDGVNASGQTAREDALRQQKPLWKYLGMFTIVMLVTYVLLAIGMIVFAVIYGSMHHL